MEFLDARFLSHMLIELFVDLCLLVVVLISEFTLKHDDSTSNFYVHPFLDKYYFKSIIIYNFCSNATISLVLEMEVFEPNV